MPRILARRANYRADLFLTAPSGNRKKKMAACEGFPGPPGVKCTQASNRGGGFHGRLSVDRISRSVRIARLRATLRARADAARRWRGRDVVPGRERRVRRAPVREAAR